MISEEKRASYCGPVFVTGIAPARMHLTSQEVRPPRPPTPSEEVPTADPGDERTQRKLEIEQEIAMLQSESDSSEDDEYLRSACKRVGISVGVGTLLRTCTNPSVEGNALPEVLP